jgi:hypothetical protein
VQLIGLEDDQSEERGFHLDERMQVTIYCLGEFAGGDGMADGGWLLDAATRKRVWALGPGNFKHAGGAPKNKLARETITLPAGDYLVYYSCDGSHSAGAWNAPPPYDPDFWGITIWAASASRRAASAVRGQGHRPGALRRSSSKATIPTAPKASRCRAPPSYASTRSAIRPRQSSSTRAGSRTSTPTGASGK